MRALPLLLALLVALAPLSVAEDGEEGQEPAHESSSSSSSTSKTETTRPTPPPDCARENATPAEREECKDHFCAENPQAAACASRPAPNATKPEPNDPSDDRERDRLEQWCRSEERNDEQVDKCQRVLQEFRDGVEDDHWVTFRADEANRTIEDLRVAGRLAIRSIHFDAGSGDVALERVGRMLRIGDNDTALVLHDDPTGLLRFKGDDGQVVLTFPSGIVHVDTENGARLHYTSGMDALLLADNATWLDDQTVLITGFAAFHIPARDTVAGDDPPKAVEANERVKDAIERRQVGAEISLKRPEAAQAAALVDPVDDGDNRTVQVLAYDDVEVSVDYDALADPNTPIRVEVSSELDEGRTIVLHLDDELVEGADADELLLRYYDLHNQTDGTILETEVVLVMADSLADVLDPSDDGGSPEYWIVADADGLQVLFSVPHWSAHALTVTSLASVVGTPSVVIGIVAGAAVSVLAGAMLFWPRRQDEDEF